MKSRVIKAVAVAVGVASGSAFPAWAQSEEETTIEFAPDDEPLDGTQSPSASRNEASNIDATLRGPPSPKASRSQPGELSGPPTPFGAGTSTGLTNEVIRPSTAKKPGARVFGRYRVRIGAANPTFTENLKYYKELYGSPSVYPVFAADWFAWDWYVTFGLSLRTGLYTADGKAAKSSDSSRTAGNIEKDETSTTTLTLIPTQLTLAAEFTPFSQKWLVIDGWFGTERLYFQEVRSGAKAKTAQAFMRPLAVTTSDDSLTNNGFKSSLVSGAAMNILLNALDEQSAQSMRGSMGLASIYLSPYIEFIRQTSGGVDFSRVNRGITFTFETVY